MPGEDAKLSLNEKVRKNEDGQSRATYYLCHRGLESHCQSTDSNNIDTDSNIMPWNLPLDSKSSYKHGQTEDQNDNIIYVYDIRHAGSNFNATLPAFPGLNPLESHFSSVNSHNTQNNANVVAFLLSVSLVAPALARPMLLLRPYHRARVNEHTVLLGALERSKELCVRVNIYFDVALAASLCFLQRNDEQISMPLLFLLLMNDSAALSYCLLHICFCSYSTALSLQQAGATRPSLSFVLSPGLINKQARQGQPVKC